MIEFITDPEFWVLVAFVVVIGGMVYKGGPAITAMLDERSQKIRQDLDEARRLRDEAQAALADYQRKQLDARKEAETILAHARAEAERAAERGQRDLEAALERRRKMASERIALEEAKAIADVRNTAVDIAVAAVRRALQDQLEPGRKAQLVDDAIEQLPQALN
jgi:F-type H+-transporting ATPase subunit b